MNKRRYRSVECKHLDWQGLAESLNGQRVVLSIDVAKEAFVAAILVEGRVVARVKWTHPGETRDWLTGVETMAAAGQLEAVMEPSGVYGDALRWQLIQRGIKVCLASPKRVHDAAEVYDGVPSLHDAKAAEIIGELHLHGASRPWREPTPEQRAMHTQLTRLRISQQVYQAELNRLEAALSRHWPESLVLLGQDSHSLHRLLAAFGGPERIRRHVEEARALLRREGGHWLCPEKIEQLLISAGDTLGVPCLAEESETIQWLAQRLVASHPPIRAMEREIERQVGGNETLMNMAEVVGKVTSAVLWSAQGDPRDYPNAASYCKGMGLNLKEHSSGQHKGPVQITKRGPSVTRFYLYYAALRLIAKEPLVQRWFEAKTRRPGAIKLKSVVELMRKLAKGLWHLAQGEAFDIEKLFNLKAVENA